MFYKGAFKRTLCGSKWTTYKSQSKLSSTGRVGCCTSGKYMSSPEHNPFLIAKSCSSCPVGRYGFDGENDDTSCSICPKGKTNDLGSAGISSCLSSILITCTPTQVKNSDKAGENSITGM